METETRVVILMHTVEAKRERTNTGRLSHLALGNSEIIVGIGFDGNDRVNALLDDPRNYCVLLYPGKNARNLSSGGLGRSELSGRRLVVFILDGTWDHAKRMYLMSSRVAALPQVKFESSEPSRWLIKKQPREFCLATIEAIHELLLSLESSGLDHYDDKDQLLSLFARMQANQLRYTEDAGLRRIRYIHKDGEGNE